MIVELLFAPIFILLDMIVAMIPIGATMPLWGLDTINLLSKGLMFFPRDVWAFVIGNIIFWLMAQLTWAIIEWVYKKIPGVD